MGKGLDKGATQLRIEGQCRAGDWVVPEAMLTGCTLCGSNDHSTVGCPMRAQQPQSVEAVAWTWQGALDQLKGYCPEGVAVFGHKGPGVPIPLYTTPQPSAGVVMPDDIDSLDVSIDLIDRLQHSNMSVKELELASSEKNVLVNKVRKLLARLNGKEVGRG